MKNKLLITAVILFILGSIFMYCGFNKKNVYDNGEYSWSEHTNAYVGGDAYNYIINGTYFTGYAVIGTGLYISGFICIVGAELIGISTEKRDVLTKLLSENQKETISDEEKKIKRMLQEELPEI